MTSHQSVHHERGVHSGHSVQMTLREPLRLQNLRLPFAIRLTARRGGHRLASNRRAGILEEGASCDLPAYQTLHYEGPVIEDARAGHRLHLLVDAHMPSAMRCLAGNAPLKLAIRVAQAVFRDPGADWSLSYAAQYAGMANRAFSTQLFREGTALTPIVCEQRLMRALLAVLEAQPGQTHIGNIAVQNGFASRTRFETLFSRRFGCGAGQLAKRAWSPDLTWSAVDRSALER